VAKYKPTNPSQGHFLPVFFHKQLQKGTFEYAINHLIDEELDLSHLDVRYQNLPVAKTEDDYRSLLPQGLTTEQLVLPRNFSVV